MKKPPLLIELNDQKVGCPPRCKGCVNGLLKGTLDNSLSDKKAINTFKAIQEYLEATKTEWIFSYLFPIRDNIHKTLPFIQNSGLLKQIQFNYGPIDDIAITTDVLTKAANDFQGKVDFLLSNSSLGDVSQSLNFTTESTNLTESHIQLLKEMATHVIQKINNNAQTNGEIGIVNNTAGFIEEKINSIDKNVLPIDLLKELEAGFHNSPPERSEPLSGQFFRKAMHFKWGKEIEKYFEMYHRIIAPNKRSSKEQAVTEILSNGPFAISIHPKIIMFNHSAFESHNSLLWTSHESFLKMMKENRELGLREIGKKLVLKNVIQRHKS